MLMINCFNLLTPSTSKKNDERGGNINIIDTSNMKTRHDRMYNAVSIKNEASHNFLLTTAMEKKKMQTLNL